jgi:coenzyme F420-reducing hydrogenase beta subunit
MKTGANRYKKLYDTVIKNGYSVRSGSYSVLDKSIKTELNEFGEYSPIFQPSDGQKDNPKLAYVCAMSDDSPDEDVIGGELFASIPGIKHDPILGYYNGLFAGHVIEGSYRENASSGGFTTWILKELLERKLVDGVIHVKETADDSDVLFEYGISRSIEEICAGAKTRYYPVEFSNVINEIKSLPGKYAIVGIPSFIMEIRLLAQQDPKVKDRVKYTLGLICGHQKSTKYAECFAWQCGIKPGNLKSIDFRKKIAGAPANMYATEVTGIINGKEVTITKKQEELLGSHWGHGFFKTKFSDFTDDTMNETADIALGDAWLPAYTKDSLGNNVLIVRNETMLSILEEGVKDGKIKVDNLSVKDVIKSQSGLVHHTRDDLPYRLYKKDAKHEWRPTKRLPASNDIPFLRKVVQDLRCDIAEQSHVHYKKAVELDDLSYFETKMSSYLRRYKWVYVVVQLKRRGLMWAVRRFVSTIR